MSGENNHETVLRDAAVDALNIRPDGVYADLTFGRGGHSKEILQRLGSAGRLIALDKDPQAVAVGQQWQDPRFSICHSGFDQVSAQLDRLGVGMLDGVLMDLGVSSPQLDEASRGFSFRFDAPLDMRMNTTSGLTAAEWLAQVTETELREVLWAYGEERNARRIAAAIVAQQARVPITHTQQLAHLVAAVMPGRDTGQNPATRTFQAIRIHINRELEELSLTLPLVADRLATGGRLVVIAFHSLEDRLVKRFMRQRSNPPLMPAKLPLRADQIPSPGMRLIGWAVRPSEAEVARNPRARSAVMRTIEMVKS